MLWRFSIHNEDCDKILAVLEYDWDLDKYVMHIQPDVVVEEDCPPGLICIFLEDNKYEVNDKFCRLFIRDRVIPPYRQNIGQILREIGEEYYHECFMLKYFPKSTLDWAMVELIEIEEDGVVSKIKGS